MLLLSLIVLDLALGAGNPNSQPQTVEKLLGRDSRWFIQLFSSPYVVSSSAMGLQPHLWDFPPHWKKRSLMLQTSLDHLWTREIVGGSLWHVIPIVSLTILSPVVPTILFLVLPRSSPVCPGLHLLLSSPACLKLNYLIFWKLVQIWFKWE